MNIVIKTMSVKDFNTASSIMSGHRGENTERQKMKGLINELLVKQYIDVPEKDFKAMRAFCKRRSIKTGKEFKCYTISNVHRILRIE